MISLNRVHNWINKQTEKLRNHNDAKQWGLDFHSNKVSLDKLLTIDQLQKDKRKLDQNIKRTFGDVKNITSFSVGENLTYTINEKEYTVTKETITNFLEEVILWDAERFIKKAEIRKMDYDDVLASYVGNKLKPLVKKLYLSDTPFEKEEQTPSRKFIQGLGSMGLGSKIRSFYGTAYLKSFA